MQVMHPTQRLGFIAKAFFLPPKASPPLFLHKELDFFSLIYYIMNWCLFPVKQALRLKFTPVKFKIQ
jgi:hypothetical protein